MFSGTKKENYMKNNHESQTWRRTQSQSDPHPLPNSLLTGNLNARTGNLNRKVPIEFRLTYSECTAQIAPCFLR